MCIYICKGGLENTEFIISECTWVSFPTREVDAVANDEIVALSSSVSFTVTVVLSHMKMYLTIL